LGFNVVVFTNLTRDHLDYHQSLDEYFSDKARLFTGEIGSKPRVAVIYVDDGYGERLVSMVPNDVRAVTFGEKPTAMIRAENVQLNFKSSSFRLVWPEGSMDVESPLIGRYNVSNLLAAVAVVWSMGRDPRSFM